jgi:hypothetical protein
MPFKPNYRFARSERERLKKAKKDEKLRRQQERAPLHQDDIPAASDQSEGQTSTDSLRLKPAIGSVD